MYKINTQASILIILIISIIFYASHEWTIFLLLFTTILSFFLALFWKLKGGTWNAIKSTAKSLKKYYFKNTADRWWSGRGAGSRTSGSSGGGGGAIRGTAGAHASDRSTSTAAMLLKSPSNTMLAKKTLVLDLDETLVHSSTRGTRYMTLLLLHI